MINEEELLLKLIEGHIDNFNPVKVMLFNVKKKGPLVKRGIAIINSKISNENNQDEINRLNYLKGYFEEFLDKYKDFK